MSCLPLELRLRGKSTTQSHRTPIYYVDLTTRSGATLADALAEAKAERERRREAGFDQAGLDLAASVGFANGAFEELDEDGSFCAEEFFPKEQADENQHNRKSTSAPPQQGLEDRLGTRLTQSKSGIAGR